MERLSRLRVALLDTVGGAVARECGPPNDLPALGARTTVEVRRRAACSGDAGRRAAKDRRRARREAGLGAILADMTRLGIGRRSSCRAPTTGR